jgi:hypothetical protein
MRGMKSNCQYIAATALILSVAGCAGQDPQVAESLPQDLPVLGEFEGYSDGHTFVIRPLDQSGLDNDGVGAAVAPLVTLDAGTLPTGTSGTGTNYVALEQVSRGTWVDGTLSSWPTTQCGTPATPNNAGVCVQIRLRNLFSRQIDRAYVELTSLTPRSPATSAEVPAPSAATFTATADFGLAPAVANGLWRYGTVGRTSAVGSGPVVWWAFYGATTPGSGLSFNFRFQVRGLLRNGTQRASLDTGVLDDPATDYPDRAAAEATVVRNNIGMSQDGRYVVFASSSALLLGDFAGAAGVHIFRKDLQTGAVDLVSRTSTGAVPSTGCTAGNPHVSADGNVVAFESTGCQLTSQGTPTVSQVYVRNISANTTVLASRSTSVTLADRAAKNPRVSGNGTAVVFDSDATNLAVGHPGGRVGCSEVYRFDLGTSVMRRLTRPRGVSGGVWMNLGTPTANCSGDVVPGREPDVSSDGRFIVFESGFRIDSVNDPDTQLDVYVYDHVATGSGAVVSYRVSRTTSGADPNGPAYNASVSADGTTVAFLSTSTNLVGTSSGREQVYARPVAEASFGSLEMQSRTPDGVEGTNGTIAQGYPALSSTGRFVAFWNSSNIASPYTPGAVQMYVCDRTATMTSIRRCFVTTMFQPTGGSAFAPHLGSTFVRFRLGLSGEAASLDEGAAVAYLANPSNWGTLGASDAQVFVSPVGDPRSQMPNTTVP